jgi:hypothetical protein
MSILVNLHLAVQTLNVEKSTTKLSVHVCHRILEVRPVVDLNVLSVPNVPMIKLASIKNVLIHVLIDVVKMHCVA